MINEAGCYIWTGNITRTGYAMTCWDGKYQSAHRLLFFLKTGIWSSRERPLDHICRVRHCVNPDHLELVTPKINSRRGLAGWENHNKYKTHCPQGHEYTEENTRRFGNQGRKCLACMKIRGKKYRDKNKEKYKAYKAEWFKKNYIPRERPKHYKKRWTK